jgi:hypothetical protein
MLGVYAVALMFDVETVSFTFLLGFPIIAGWVILHFRPKGSFQTLVGGCLWLIGIAVASILGSLATGLEGLICIAMAVVPILLGTLAGGVLYLVYMRWRQETRGTLKLAVLPVLGLILFSGVQDPVPRTYVITNTITIDAAPSRVFSMLKTIPNIAPEEIPTRMSHLLGVPKPTAAVWQETATGAVRHSHWGEDVHFREVITNIEQDARIDWTFAFPDGWIADGIEDPHITVGGRYFDVLTGGYVLEEVDGKTRLSLTTRTYDNSGLGLYAEFWHHFFFEDFHEVILELVKMRTEMQA